MEYASMCSWDMESALNKYAPLHSLKKYNIQPKPTKPVDTKITQERIQKSYQIAASAVKEYGDIYLKIFERLHNEVEGLEMKQSLLNTAFKIADEEKQS